MQEEQPRFGDYEKKVGCGYIISLQRWLKTPLYRCRKIALCGWEGTIHTVHHPSHDIQTHPSLPLLKVTFQLPSLAHTKRIMVLIKSGRINLALLPLPCFRWPCVIPHIRLLGQVIIRKMPDDRWMASHVCKSNTLKKIWLQWVWLIRRAMFVLGLSHQTSEDVTWMAWEKAFWQEKNACFLRLKPGWSATLVTNLSLT